MNCKIINKLFIFSFLLSFASVFCYGQNLKLSKESFNFGDLELKDKRNVSLYAINVSKKPLVIKDAEIACSCTKLNYSKRPIMPNDSTLLKITFDAKDRGTFYKKIILFHTGEEKNSTIILRGVVK